MLERRPNIEAKLFTEIERSICRAGADPALHFAGRFAAKEAVRKVLERPVAWHEVEIGRAPSGAPTLALGSAVREEIGAATVSISHDGGVAVAVVLVELVHN